MNKFLLIAALAAGISSFGITSQKEQTVAQKPAEQIAKEDKPAAGEEIAVIETNLGRILIRFFPKVAPGHVENFKKLATKGFYDGVKFHRVIPGFMIQGGDPNSKDDNRSDDGTGGPGYKIKAEFSDTPHVRGILSMARTPDPDSAGSQFFIMVSDKAFLDGKYSVFGKVIQGMDVVDKIVALPRDAKDNPLAENPAIMKSVKIAKWPLTSGK
jgi:peptidyl-prolyl cis-trans isomerase B (cyclophilin B)